MSREARLLLLLSRSDGCAWDRAHYEEPNRVSGSPERRFGCVVILNDSSYAEARRLSVVVIRSNNTSFIGHKSLAINLLSKLDSAADRIYKQARNLVVFRWRMPRVYDLYMDIAVRLVGRKVRLDASTKCQLKCEKCITADGSLRDTVVGWGHLSLENFKALVDHNPEIKKIELSNWGEILLNRDIVGIMRHAHEHNIRLTAGNGVNLNHLTEEAAEALVKYGFYHLSISIDGADQDSYEIYRRGGDFNKVVENIQRINHYKRKYHSNLPRLTWQYIIFGHNEHLLAKARSMSEELGMHFKPKLNFSTDYSPIKDHEFVRRETGLSATTRTEYVKQKGQPYTLPCYQLWTEPQINWDGKLLGCCANRYGDFGNVFTSGIKPLLNSPKYRYAKQMLVGRAPADETIPCAQCPYYLKMNHN